MMPETMQSIVAATLEVKDRAEELGFHVRAVAVNGACLAFYTQGGGEGPGTIIEKFETPAKAKAWLDGYDYSKRTCGK